VLAANDRRLRLAPEHMGRQLRWDQLVQLVYVTHAPTEHDHIGVQDIYGMGQGPSQPVGISLQSAPGSTIPFTGQGDNPLSLEL
jgi:hypothetical protein